MRACRSGRRLVAAILSLGPFLPFNEPRGRLFIRNQNDIADNDQNYSCKFRKGKLFTKQKPDHHSGCDSPGNTNWSANR